jgi:hypothetical protein
MGGEEGSGVFVRNKRGCRGGLGKSRNSFPGRVPERALLLY